MRVWLIVGGLAVAVAIGVGIYVYATRPNGGLDPKIATAYLDAQAHALCVVQETAFPTQSAQKAAYEKAEQDSSLTTAEFAEAQAAAAKDEALRARLSDRVVALCG